MKPSMHRKARISNPTFKTSPQYMQQERRNHPPLFYYPSPCPSDAAGALSSRSIASSMARLIKPFTLSLWASAWALAVKAACFQSLRVYFYGCINFFLSNRNFFYILHATMLHNFGFTAIYVGNYFIFRYCCRKYFS